MTRILRAWRVQAYLDFMFLVRDRKNCLVYMVADLILTLAAVTGVLLLAERFGGIGAWRKPQVVFMLGFSSLAMIISEMMFGYNVLWISRRIGRGQLDHLLIQPRPLWKALLTEGFIPSSMWPALIPGITLTAWSLANIQMTMDFAWWAAYTVNLVSGVAIVTAFSYIWGSLAFWAPVGAEELSTNVLNLLSELKPFPLDGLGRGLKMSLLSIIPAGFVAWFPAGALLGFRDTQTALLVTPVAALALGLLAALIFKRGLAHYARTGSQRYTDFGHRR